jgi:quinol-cytochrome oxidoreductase complex cytochrome b subunit
VQEEFADIDRRPIWTTLFATFVFFSVGPGVAGALADSGSFAPVLVVAGTAIVLSMVQMRYSDRFRQL